MKGQIVADFIVEHGLVELSENLVDQPNWKLFFDGSNHKNGSGIGVLIISPQGLPTKFHYRMNGVCSNNKVEYEALITGLKPLIDLGATRVEIRGDSELAIRQIKKEYKCIKENLIVCYAIVVRLLEKFEYVEILHVPRSDNYVANELAQIASGYRVSKRKLKDMVEIKEKETQEVLDKIGQLSTPKLGGVDDKISKNEDSDIVEIFAIDNMADSDWRNSLVQYLNNPVGGTDRKIKYRALNYVILGNELYKKTAEGVLLKCLSEAEAYLAVSEVHSGACGAHQSGYKMKCLLFRQENFKGLS
ncbi:uncharacterized protein LOC131648900 [Vicia villosa]|uniref:uncharacterized protein LOC131648900 n=1 Tax=Vicia villosa TaxID=3911 RepID=UPI00273B101F|nr:uncharacterized protein LOC131648900 [Vicia villosa]